MNGSKQVDVGSQEHIISNANLRTIQEGAVEINIYIIADVGVAAVIEVDGRVDFNVPAQCAKQIL